MFRFRYNILKSRTRYPIEECVCLLKRLKDCFSPPLLKSHGPEVEHGIGAKFNQWKIIIIKPCTSGFLACSSLQRSPWMQSYVEMSGRPHSCRTLDWMPYLYHRCDPKKLSLPSANMIFSFGRAPIGIANLVWEVQTPSSSLEKYTGETIAQLS